jgi:small subunit ribosomal protein S21
VTYIDEKIMKPYNRNFRSSWSTPWKGKSPHSPHRKQDYSTPHYERPRETGREVLVENDNIEKAIRRLKKKIDREGLIREIRDRTAYQKPSEKRKIARQQAIERWRKQKRLMDRLL